MKVFVIVPAAGRGTRMAPASAAKSRKKAPTKQFKELGGVPILVHTLRKFAAAPAVYEITVALRKDEIAGFRAQVEKQYPEILSKRLQMVAGGEHPQDKVRGRRRRWILARSRRLQHIEWVVQSSVVSRWSFAVRLGLLARGNHRVGRLLSANDQRPTTSDPPN